MAMRQTNVWRLAKEAVEQAQRLEARHRNTFGGFQHQGAGNPLLTDMPLPKGWGRKA